MPNPIENLNSQRLLRPALPGGAVALSTTSDFPATHGKNFTRVAEELGKLLGGTNAEAVFAEQTHGHGIALLDSQIAATTSDGPGWREIANCDALATSSPGIALVVRTADCVPILVSDSSRPFIAAVHAGWRGTLERILERTLQLALDTGSRPGDLWVWMGPHIRREHYQVSPDLLADFHQRFGHLADIGVGRQLDLTAVNTLQAETAGVPPEQIADCGLCTFARQDLYPSYRRDGECRGQIFTGLILPPTGD